MKLRVNRDPKDNGFCGPAALSIITGKPVSEVVKILHDITGRSQIKGMFNSEMERALLHMGYGVQFVPISSTPSPRKPTLAGWLKTTWKTRDPKATYLINVTRHYIVLRGRKIADSKHERGVFLREFSQRRKRVVKIWRVEKCAK